MPNHVTNVIKIHGDHKQVLESIKGKPDDKGHVPLIDFNALIPMPDELHIISDGFVMMIENEYSYKFDKLEKLRNVLSGDPKPTEEQVDNFCKAIKNFWQFGHATWYSWSIENWGTKWNAYSQESLSDNSIKFQTAWSHPKTIINTLAANFPDVTFEIKYADEDIGSNLGWYEIKGRLITDRSSEIGDEIKFACELNDYDYSQYMRERES